MRFIQLYLCTQPFRILVFRVNKCIHWFRFSRKIQQLKESGLIALWIQQEQDLVAQRVEGGLSSIEDCRKGSFQNRSDPVYILFRVGPEWNRPSLPGEHAAHICGEIWFSQMGFDPTQILQRFGLFSYSHRSCFFSLSSSLIRYIFTGNKRRKHHLIGACDKGPGFSLRSPLLRYIAIQSIWCLERMKLFKHFIAFTKETKSSPLLRYMLPVNNYTGT